MSHLTRHLVDRKRNLEKDLAEVEPQRKWYNERFDELSAELAEIDVAIAALSPMPEAGEGAGIGLIDTGLGDLITAAEKARDEAHTHLSQLGGLFKDDYAREGQTGPRTILQEDSPQPEPDHLAEFLKRPGAVLHVTNMQPVADEVEVVVLRRDGEVLDQGNAVGRNAACYRWDESHPHSLDYPNDIIAYAPAQPATPEQGLGEIENTEGQAERLASEVLNQMGAKLAEALAESDAPAIETRVDGDLLVVREISAEEYYQPADINVTPATNPEADMLAHGILKDAERKASEPKHSVIGRLFGGTKSFAKPEGVV